MVTEPDVAANTSEETLVDCCVERIFIGIKLPDPISTLLLDRFKLSTEHLPGVKWEKEENLHITLRFVGDMTTTQRVELQERLQEVLGNNHKFRTSLTNFSMFPKKGDFRILHCALSGCEDLFNNIRDDIDTTLKMCNIAIAAKDCLKLIPHVTLARNRRSKRSKVKSWIESLGEFEHIPFDISEVQLFRSHLSSEGSSYQILQTYELSDL